MEMMVYLMSGGIGIPKSKFGLSRAAVYVGFKHNFKSKPFFYGFDSDATLGELHALGVAWVQTKWFTLSQHHKISHIEQLSGKTGIIGVKTKQQKADIKFEVYDKNGDEESSASKIDIPTDHAILTGDFEAKAKLVFFPGMKL